MKPIGMVLAIVVLVGSILSGCVVVPLGGYGYGYHDHYRGGPYYHDYHRR